VQRAAEAAGKSKNAGKERFRYPQADGQADLAASLAAEAAEWQEKEKGDKTE
jgi:hypothetical protein